MTSTEQRKIEAALGYIAKLRSMHPDPSVLRRLDEIEAELRSGLFPLEPQGHSTARALEHAS